MTEVPKSKRQNIQIFLVGSSNSGKTSLYLKLKDNTFYELLNATIGYHFSLVLKGKSRTIIIDCEKFPFLSLLQVQKILKTRKKQVQKNYFFSQMTGDLRNLQVTQETNQIRCYIYIIKLQINGIQETVQIWDTQGFDNNPGILSIPQYKQAKGFIVMYDITDENSFYNVQKCVDEIKNYCSVQNHNILLIGNKKDQKQLRQVSIEKEMQYSQEQEIQFRQISVKNMEHWKLKNLIQQRVKLLAAKVVASSVRKQKSEEQKDKNVVIKKIDFQNNRNRGCWKNFSDFFKRFFQYLS